MERKHQKKKVSDLKSIFTGFNSLPILNKWLTPLRRPRENFAAILLSMRSKEQGSDVWSKEQSQEQSKQVI